MINAIIYAEELERVGFSKEQASKSVKIWMELMNQNFATKNDLSRETGELRMEVLELRKDMEKMELRLTNRLGAIMITGLTLASTSVGLIVKLL